MKTTSVRFLDGIRLPRGLKIAAALAGFGLAVAAGCFAATGATAAPAPAAAQATGEVVTLAQCVEQVMASGPDMKISAATLSAARAQYVQAAAANGVGLNGTLSANRSPTTTGYLQGVPVQSSLDTFQAGLDLNAPLSTAVSLSASHSITEESSPHQVTTVSVGANTTLWDGYPGGQALGAAQEAALALQVTQSSESANQKNAIYQVKQDYYTLLGQQGQIGILQQTLTQRQEELKKTQALIDAESASQIDLKQAQVNLVQAQLDLAKAQDTLEVDREQLSAVMGWPLDRVYTVAEVQGLQAPSVSVEDAVKTALANRQDLRQIQLNLPVRGDSAGPEQGAGEPDRHREHGAGLLPGLDFERQPAQFQGGRVSEGARHRPGFHSRSR